MKPPVALLLPLAIAACGSPGGNGAARANKAAAATSANPATAAPAAPGAPAAASGERLQAGQWELTAMIRSIDAPGAPAGQQAALRRRLGRPLANRTCLTEAQTRDFASFGNRVGPPRGCTIGDRVYANGIIRMSLSCSVPGRPGTIRATTVGRYTPTTLEVATNQETPGPGGGTMRMSATISGRRIGACPAAAAGPPLPRVRPPSNRAPVVVPPSPPPAR
jgi:hypothetical protein